MTEAVSQSCSVKKVFLEILQNSQGNTCVRASACNFIKKENVTQVFSCEFGEISNNTLFYRTPPVAASVMSNVKWKIFRTPRIDNQWII